MLALSSSPRRFLRVVLAALVVALAIALFALLVHGRGAARSAAPEISLDNHPISLPRDI